MNILDTMKQALEALEIADISDESHSYQAEINNLRTVIEQIEKAEPICFVSYDEESGIVEIRDAANPHNRDLIPLYAFPPDAQAEIERLTNERDKFYAELIHTRQRLQGAMSNVAELRCQLAEHEGKVR